MGTRLVTFPATWRVRLSGVSACCADRGPVRPLCGGDEPLPLPHPPSQSASGPTCVSCAPVSQAACIVQALSPSDHDNASVRFRFATLRSPIRLPSDSVEPPGIPHRLRQVERPTASPPAWANTGDRQVLTVRFGCPANEIHGRTTAASLCSDRSPAVASFRGRPHSCQLHHVSSARLEQ